MVYMCLVARVLPPAVPHNYPENWQAVEKVYCFAIRNKVMFMVHTANCWVDCKPIQWNSKITLCAEIGEMYVMAC